MPSDSAMQPQTKTRGHKKDSFIHVWKNDAAQLVLGGATIQVHFTVKDYDYLNEFNTATWLFTAQKTGKYLIVFNIDIQIAGLGEVLIAFLDINGVGSARYENYVPLGFAGTWDVAGTFMHHLNAGDTIGIRYNNANVANQTVVNNLYTNLKIRRIR